jgi:hypothetical protein
MSNAAEIEIQLLRASIPHVHPNGYEGSLLVLQPDALDLRGLRDTEVSGVSEYINEHDFSSEAAERDSAAPPLLQDEIGGRLPYPRLSRQGGSQADEQ